MNEKVIGIDLASSQSVVAIINEMGKPEVIANAEGKRLTPSVILIDKEERKVGSAAQRQAVMKPKNTIALIKRFMGGKYNDENIQKAIKYASFDVVNNPPKTRITKLESSLYKVSLPPLTSVKYCVCVE